MERFVRILLSPEGEGDENARVEGLQELRKAMTGKFRSAVETRDRMEATPGFVEAVIRCALDGESIRLREGGMAALAQFLIGAASRRRKLGEIDGVVDRLIERIREGTDKEAAYAAQSIGNAMVDEEDFKLRLSRHERFIPHVLMLANREDHRCKNRAAGTLANFVSGSDIRREKLVHTEGAIETILDLMVNGDTDAKEWSSRAFFHILSARDTVLEVAERKQVVPLLISLAEGDLNAKAKWGTKCLACIVMGIPKWIPQAAEHVERMCLIFAKCLADARAKERWRIAAAESLVEIDRKPGFHEAYRLSIQSHESKLPEKEEEEIIPKDKIPNPSIILVQTINKVAGLNDLLRAIERNLDCSPLIICCARIIRRVLQQADDLEKIVATIENPGILRNAAERHGTICPDLIEVMAALNGDIAT